MFILCLNYLFKEEVQAAVDQLLKLKGEYKKLTGTDYVPASGATARVEKEKKPAAKKPEHEQNADAAGDSKKLTKYVL